MNQLRMRIATGNELGFLVTGGDVESVSAISVIGEVMLNSLKEVNIENRE